MSIDFQIYFSPEREYEIQLLEDHFKRLNNYVENLKTGGVSKTFLTGKIMANPRKKKSGEILIPRNCVADERLAFKKAVKKTRTSSTATDSRDDMLFDDSSTTASTSKKPNKMALGASPAAPERLEQVNPLEDSIKNDRAFPFAFKVMMAILGLIVPVMATVYFFNEFSSKTTANTTNISNLEKNVESLKNDLNSSINKIENRLDPKINRLDSRLDQKK